MYSTKYRILFLNEKLKSNLKINNQLTAVELFCLLNYFDTSQILSNYKRCMALPRIPALKRHNNAHLSRNSRSLKAEIKIYFRSSRIIYFFHFTI